MPPPLSLKVGQLVEDLSAELNIPMPEVHHVLSRIAIRR